MIYENRTSAFMRGFYARRYRRIELCARDLQLASILLPKRKINHACDAFMAYANEAWCSGCARRARYIRDKLKKLRG
jgi:hypothetical protein